jgi:hypothetical protein
MSNSKLGLGPCKHIKFGSNLGLGSYKPTWFNSKLGSSPCKHLLNLILTQVWVHLNMHAQQWF